MLHVFVVAIAQAPATQYRTIGNLDLSDAIHMFAAAIIAQTALQCTGIGLAAYITQTAWTLALQVSAAAAPENCGYSVCTSDILHHQCRTAVLHCMCLLLQLHISHSAGTAE